MARSHIYGLWSQPICMYGLWSQVVLMFTAHNHVKTDCPQTYSPWSRPTAPHAPFAGDWIKVIADTTKFIKAFDVDTDNIPRVTITDNSRN